MTGTTLAQLELADIQGNILTAYGKIGFPKARHLLLHINDAAAGRATIEWLRHRVTTALRWPSRRKGTPTGPQSVDRPAVTLNLGFTFSGLLALGVPTRTLRGLPDDFIDGMSARASILGDGDRQSWDPVWLAAGSGRPHVLVALNAQMQADGHPVPALDELTALIIAHCAQSAGGVTLLSGHRGPQTRWQELSALLEQGPDGSWVPSPREHFGYIDGVSDPVFDGQYADGETHRRAQGNGKIDGKGAWSALATGEFLLGWPDEAQEIPGSAMPLDFSRNGTFVAYRKLHQDVAGFAAWVDRTAQQFGAHWQLADPKAARATLLAKMAGRWQDGVPLIAAPDYPAWLAFNRSWPGDGTAAQQAERALRLVTFTYGQDRDGAKCPVTAHVRRSNTRDMLDPQGTNPDMSVRSGSALNNRRRILRRGLPYGSVSQDDGEHGIVMLATCASLSRQFEFVQQQWLDYGLDFGAGNDTCPLVGNHGPDAKFVIAAEPGSGLAPFIASGLPQAVSARGGDYFFVPSMTALRMIAMGTIDPT